MRPTLRMLLAPLVGLLLAPALAVVPAEGAEAEPAVEAEPAATALGVRLVRMVSTADGPGERRAAYGVFFDGSGPAIAEDTFLVRGRLTSEGVGLGDKSVTLFRKEPGATAEVVGTTTTAADGRYRFTNTEGAEVQQRVGRTADYFAVFSSDTETLQSATSRVVTLPAMRDFNAVKRRVNGKLFFRGVVRPSWGNRVVTLQKQACRSCAWRTVTSRRTGPAGGWSFRVYHPRKVGPVWHWQVVLPARGAFVKSYSSVLATRRVYARVASDD